MVLFKYLREVVFPPFDPTLKNATASSMKPAFPAIHLYFAVSFFCTEGNSNDPLGKISLPVVFSNGFQPSSPFALLMYHRILGLGMPVALQLNSTVLFTFAVTFFGFNMILAKSTQKDKCKEKEFGFALANQNAEEKSWMEFYN